MYLCLSNAWNGYALLNMMYAAMYIYSKDTAAQELFNRKYFTDN